MYPQQLDPASQFEIVAEKVPGSGIDSLTERVGKKLGREGQLITTFGAQVLGTILHQELKSLWDKSGEISVGELWGYFTRIFICRVSLIAMCWMRRSNRHFPRYF